MKKIKVAVDALHRHWNSCAGEVYVKTPDGKLVPVLDTMTLRDRECVEVTFEGGAKRRVAETHRFMAPDGEEVFAKDAFEVKTSQGTAKVVDRKQIGVHDVFDISIEDPHWYVDQHGIIHHNCGKSTWLIQQAGDALLDGKDVAYFTMEMAEEVVQERVDVYVNNITFDQLHALEKEQYLTKMKKIREKTSGKLMIKEFPTGKAHMGHLRHTLNEWRTKNGFKPFLIVIDYLTICASETLPASVKQNSNTYYTTVAEEIRALANEFDARVWTGCQFDRTGQTAEDVDMTNTGLAIGIQATSDFSLAIMAPEELAAENKCIGKILKSRYNNKSKVKKFLLGLDNDRQRFYDLDDSEQSHVMDKEEQAEFNHAQPAITKAGQMVMQSASGWNFS